ncbi:hypothetical protein SAMN02910301_0347 [Lachnospiraceae bacterium XBD2001]|nr:hypothetical protein SAMN02910301_0347 [Lachnospiraceae bacterium XBD2001]
MLVLKTVLLFLIIPELLGVTVCGICRIWDRPFFRYISGFLCMVAMAYVIYLPLAFTGRSFHRYVQLLSIGYVFIAAIGIVFYGKRTFLELKVLAVRGADWIKKHPGIVIFLVVVAFELYRVIAYTQINYSDDDTYISLVNDIIHSDTFFRRNYVDGRNLTAWYHLDKKYYLTGWFAYQAYISRALGLHPLITVKTVLPLVLIVLHYLVVIDFLGIISRRRGEMLSYFLPIYAMLLEFGWSTYTTSLSYYFLTWVWYGKSFVEFVVLPALMGQLLVTRWNRFFDWCLLLLFILAGFGASTMGFVLIPVMCGMYFVTMMAHLIWKRRRATC